MRISKCYNWLQERFPTAEFIEVGPFYIALKLSKIESLSKPVGFMYPKATVGISGIDAQSFLNGLVTADISRLKTDAALRSLITNANGRIIFDCFIYHPKSNDYLVLVEPTEGKALFDHLNFYSITERIDIVALDDQYCWYLFGLTLDDYFYRQADLTILLNEDPNNLPAELQFIGITEFEQIRPIHRLARSGIDFDNSFLPRQAGLEHLVSFSKGCFIGQEPIARMHYKGRPTKQLMHFTHPKLLERQELYADKRRIGRITTGSSIKTEIGYHSLALCRLDALDGEITAGDVRLTASKMRLL